MCTQPEFSQNFFNDGQFPIVSLHAGLTLTGGLLVTDGRVVVAAGGLVAGTVFGSITVFDKWDQNID